MPSVVRLGCAETPLRGDDAWLEVAEEGGTLRGSGGLPIAVNGGGTLSCLAPAGSCCCWDCSMVEGGGSNVTSAAAGMSCKPPFSTLSADTCKFKGTQAP